ncbi:denticleless protein homolog [Haemaphysalis longicornis]
MGPSVLNVLREGEYLRRSGNGALTYSVLKNLHSRAASEYVVRNDMQEVPPLACTSFSEPGLRDLLAVADEDGTVHLLRTGRPTEGVALATSWQAHENAVFDVCARPGCCHLATASGDLTVGLFDVVQRMLVASFKAHRGSVKCVRFAPGHSDVFASGARDGGIVVWDARCFKPHGGRAVIANAHSMAPGGHPWDPEQERSPRGHVTTAPSSVTACVFRDENHLVTCGASSGVVKVWDLRKSYQLYKNDPRALACLPYPGQSSAVHEFPFFVPSKKGEKFGLRITCACDVNLSCGGKSDMKVGKITKNTCRWSHANASRSPPPPPFCAVGPTVYRGHSAHSFYVKLALSPDGCFLASGSTDTAAYIWQVRSPGWPKLKLVGHSKEVTALAWDHWHPARLSTCGDDNRVLLWDAAGAEDDGRERERGASFSARAEAFVAVTEVPEQKTPGRKSGAASSVSRASGGSGGKPYHQVQTPTRSLSMADWLTPPSKRRLLGPEARSSQTNATPKSSSTSAEGPSPLATSALLSPRKADNAVNVTQRRLLPRLEALATSKALVDGGGTEEGGCLAASTTVTELLGCNSENLPVQKLETPPRPAVTELVTALSAVRGRKQHKAMARLFRKQGASTDKAKKSSRAKRALLNMHPITSFFKR